MTISVIQNGSLSLKIEAKNVKFIKQLSLNVRLQLYFKPAREIARAQDTQGKHETIPIIAAVNAWLFCFGLSSFFLAL